MTTADRPAPRLVPPPAPAWVAPDREAIPFVVPPENAGQRLDRFLSLRIRWLSRSRAQRIIDEGAADRGGRRLRPSHRVLAEEVIWVYRRPLPEPPPPDLPVGVLHEDDALVVLDKPAGMTMHPTTRHRANTLTCFLRQRYPGTVARIGHRIDRETSGIVLAARHLEADRALKSLFERRLVEKLYLALVRGRPADRVGVIDLPLAQTRDGPVHIRMEARADGLPSRTRYRVLLEAGPYALVAAEPLTGRQHQVRAHLAALGCPLVGDKIYDHNGEIFLEWLAGGGRMTDDLRARLVLDRQALHAWTVALPHPTLGDRRRFTAPIPADIATLVEQHAGPGWRDALPSLARAAPPDWP
ncbi:MAG: RluA family pseudouridine synthase [Deltaproteobacteria bacterium]|nr:RluA family pseudouridine synthase [Deltaproteobacteria bacterium]